MQLNKDYTDFRKLYKKSHWSNLFVRTEYALFIKANAQIINALLEEQDALFLFSYTLWSSRRMGCYLRCFVFQRKISNSDSKAIILKIEVVEVTSNLSILCVECRALGLASGPICGQLVEQFLLELRSRGEEIEKIE